MNIAVFVSTPAQAYFFKNIIAMLQEEGHGVKVLARDYRETVYLLNQIGITHEVFGTMSNSKYGKMLQFPLHILSALKLLKGFPVDMIVGTGLYSVYPALVLRKPNIVFMDDVATDIELMLQKPFFSAAVTPANLTRSLGEKHIRVSSLKELSYLHPRYYKPDRTILDLLGVKDEEPFAVLRFNAFDSSHDVGVTGFTMDEKRRLIRELGKHGRVFVSSETTLPADLEGYSLPVPRHRIHDVLYHARLLVADTQTMVTEAAMLGTPAILYHPKAKKIGNFIELDGEYGLVSAFDKNAGLIERALELFSRQDIKIEWKVKQKRLLDEKIDIARFMVWFIETFPESFRELKENPGCQMRFAGA